MNVWVWLIIILVLGFILSNLLLLKASAGTKFEKKKLTKDNAANSSEDRES